MIQYLIKLLISAILIVAVSEISRRSSFLGGLLASLPLVSFLSLIWLYLDTHDPVKVAALSKSIFWLVLPSLIFFLALPPLLKSKLNFPLSMTLATAAMFAAYSIQILILKKMGASF